MEEFESHVMLVLRNSMNSLIKLHCIGLKSFLKNNLKVGFFFYFSKNLKVNRRTGEREMIDFP